MSDDSQKLVMKRLKQNRESARKSRERKKLYKEHLQQRIPILRKQHEEMSASLDVMLKTVRVRRFRNSRNLDSVSFHDAVPQVDVIFMCKQHEESRAQDRARTPLSHISVSLFSVFLAGILYRSADIVCCIHAQVDSTLLTHA